jgi:osmotically-inducible protein OsmY
VQDARGERDARDEPFQEPTENDPTAAVENAEPYFAPTDPVVREAADGQTKIAGGFGSGEVTTARPRAATEVAPSDEALADAVRAELALDASTAHLAIGVSVAEGVARLEGEVTDAVDAESALAVAGRVPGIVDVDDALTVGG